MQIVKTNKQTNKQKTMMNWDLLKNYWNPFARVLHMYVHKSICECFIHKYKKWMLHRAVLITLLCLTLCDSMVCSTPGSPVLHYLLEFAQTYVHWVSDAIQPSHPLLFPSPPAFNHSQHQGLFKWVPSSYQVAKGLEFQLQHQSFQWTPRTDLL